MGVFICFDATLPMDLAACSQLVSSEKPVVIMSAAMPLGAWQGTVRLSVDGRTRPQFSNGGITSSEKRPSHSPELRSRKASSALARPYSYVICSSRARVICLP